jgi:hypothetical protein
VSNGSGSPWRLDRPSLSRSLERWQATRPDATQRDLVNEWLMDLVLDPLHRGQEDPEHPGIFFGRVRGADVGVTFVPDPEHSVVYVTNIA